MCADEPAVLPPIKNAQPTKASAFANLRRSMFAQNPTHSVCDEELSTSRTVVSDCGDGTNWVRPLVKSHTVRYFQKTPNSHNVKLTTEEDDEEEASIREILQQQEAEEEEETLRRIGKPDKARRVASNWRKAKMVKNTVGILKKFSHTETTTTESATNLSDDEDFDLDEHDRIIERAREQREFVVTISRE